jgi:hypothetical protein
MQDVELIKERIPASVMWKEIVQACGTEDPSAIRDMTKLPRGSLVLWRDSPETKLTRRTVAKVRAALAAVAVVEPGQPMAREAPPPPYSSSSTIADVHRDVLEVRDLLRSLLVLGEQGRLPQVLKAKRKAGGGAA